MAGWLLGWLAAWLSGLFAGWLGLLAGSLDGWLTGLAGWFAGWFGRFGWVVWGTGLASWFCLAALVRWFAAKLVCWHAWLAACLCGYLGSLRDYFGSSCGSAGCPKPFPKLSQGETPDLSEIGSERSVWICK